MKWVAWVESPLQLINAIEYAAATGITMSIYLRKGIPQLAETSHELAPLLPEAVRLAGFRKSALASPLVSSSRRAIGDAHSGQVRAVLASTGVRNAVVVGDGTSTMRLAGQVARGEPLRRTGDQEGLLGRALATRASRLLRRAATRQSLEVFTGYSANEEVRALGALGARVRSNDYGWLRGLGLGIAPGLPAGTVVLGSALADDGLIGAQSYVDWLRAVAEREGSVTYLPHRRERAESLDGYQGIPGLDVVVSGLPVEILVGAADGVTRIVTLPSSAVATLRALAPSTVAFEVVKIPRAWWTGVADAEFRRTLDDVAGRGD